MQRRRRRHRAADVVRRDQHVVGVGPGRELLGRQNASGVRDVRLNDVGRLQLEQLAKLVGRVQPLAGRHRDPQRRDGARDLLQRPQVLWRHRLLDPARHERRQRARQLDGGHGVEASVHLDQDLHVGADRRAHRLDQRDRPQLLSPAQLVEPRAERVDLERAVAPRDHPQRGGVKLLWRPLDRVPAVRVGRDAIAHRPAQQLVHRRAKRLPDDIPARHLDHRDRRHHDLAGAGEVVPQHALDEIFDLERVRAKDVVGSGFLEIAEQRIGMIHHPHFADAAQPLVCLHEHERQVAPRRAEHDRPDSADTHRSAPR